MARNSADEYFLVYRVGHKISESYVTLYHAPLVLFDVAGESDPVTIANLSSVCMIEKIEIRSQSKVILIVSPVTS